MAVTSIWRVDTLGIVQLQRPGRSTTDKIDGVVDHSAEVSQFSLRWLELRVAPMKCERSMDGRPGDETRS